MAERVQRIDCDILIAGGGTGGTAAALAAAEAGATVCLLEETDWLGGQLTAQGVCTPDEQQFIETFGGTRRYYQFREATRRHYRENYKLTPEAAATPNLDVGNCWVSRVAFEPKVGVALLQEMARPLEEAGRLRIFYYTRVTSCEMQGRAVTAVTAESEDGTILHFSARYVLDATELGDLLPLCGEEGIDWALGAESKTETGEPDAPETARREWVQPFTFPFALDWSPATADTNVISPPKDYETLKAEQRYRTQDGAITGVFSGNMPWWNYRRVLARANFNDPKVPSDLAMINTGSNDYQSGNIIGADAEDDAESAATLARARRASLGYVHWLQTECPREDDPSRKGYPELRLRKDVFDTPDGCAKMPYIRESRRIRALRTILEQEIVVKDFQGNPCQPNARAEFMRDSVGVGHYALDIHPNGHGEPNAYVATRPFQIPLGALISKSWDNLLPACKNLGTTHLSNGAYRLHPIEWNIGESAGLLAAFCLQNHLSPQEVYIDSVQLGAFQQILLKNGIPLNWYVDVPLDHPAFEAVQRLALTDIVPGSLDDFLFHPDDPITDADWSAWNTAVGNTAISPISGTRGEAVQSLFG